MLSRRRCVIDRTLALQAARVLDREAAQLFDSYTASPGGGIPVRWECAAAKRDWDHYRLLAHRLRAAELV